MCIRGFNFLPLAVWPIRLEYFSGWQAAGLFLLLSAPIILLGLRSLTGLGKTRQRVAIGIRLLVMLMIVLILGGIRLQKTSRDLDVMVLRDISTSTSMVDDYPGKTLKDSIDNYLQAASSVKDKPADDKVGIISFQQDALIDALPNTHLTLGSKAIRADCTGTDPSAAIQLGLATMQKDAMHRLVLVWDGNPTLGDLDSALNAAVAQHVPIDVMPLHYDVQHEVMLDKIVAPTWRRQNEPFTLDIYLKSTNDFPVTGKLRVTDHGKPIDLDPATPGMQDTRDVTLPGGSPDRPAQVLVQVKVPAQETGGVHEFHATFDTDQPGANVSVGGDNGAGPKTDTLTSNNAGDAFTYVQGKGRILYVDNVPDNRGDFLGKALNEEGVEITDADHITPSEFPATLIQLQNYDAVILANVPYGPGGITEDQQKNLASYVHDLGGGLVMIGGPETFGAGGWQGKKLEEVLPVDMDIPAQRQIPKGALVMIVHSCEFPKGNYYGEQCVIKAIETLSAQDEVGIITYNWGGGSSGSNWDFPLQKKGDGSKPIAAAKQMQVGDMPSFDESMDVALHGGGGVKGLIDSNAKQKHVIIISDGDPAAPNATLVQDYKNAKVSVSTVSVYPHDSSGATLKDIAKELKGKSYGPINDNFEQLPQIFVKEATVVRRTLISENDEGIPLTRRPVNSDMVKGLGDPLPMVRGMVLTSRKPNPQIQLPIVAGRSNDPLLASWQTGLGRAAVFTSDATNQWGVWWESSPDYNKFWAQVVRSVARPPMSNQFDVSISQDGNKGHIVVEGRDKNAGFMNFLNIGGTVVSPTSDHGQHQQLVQTGPGRYEGYFDMNDAGTYVSVMQARDQDNNLINLPVGGLSMSTSPELRDLKSNDALLKEVADRTGGRVLPAFDVNHANLFSRENLAPAVSSLPIWDQLIPWLLALILVDVAARRIAWDWTAMKKYAAAGTGFIRSFTTTAQVETRGSLDALKRVRTDTSDTKPPTASAAQAPTRPDPKAKFQASGAKGGVEGNITDIVGGATNKPIPSAPKKVEPKGVVPGGGMSNLMEAKRRAQQKIKDKEQGEQ